MENMTYYGSPWFEYQLDPSKFSVLINNYVNEINKICPDVEYIICKGVSGAYLAAPLSLALNKPVLIVKKDTDTSHRTPICGWMNTDKNDASFIIVDDLIDSGKTIDTIIEIVENWGFKKHNCRGLFIHFAVWKENREDTRYNDFQLYYIDNGKI